jgi:hypothetical protein
VRSDDYRADLIQGYRAFGLGLLERDHPTNPQVFRNYSSVKGIKYLVRDFVTQMFVVLEDIPIKAVRSKAFIEVGGLSCLDDV